MPLIESRRFRDGDVERWRRMVQVDRALASSRRMAELEERALDTLAEFLAATPDAYVSVSWGKDSVVVAHLLARTGIKAPLVWFPGGFIENPDCVLVRDAFLARFPDVDYREHEVTLGDEPWDIDEGHDGAQAEFQRVSRSLYGGQYVSGVRAAESDTRALCMVRHGEASRNTCRPIGWWRTEHVFAYLAKHDLPVHPAYAMTLGGVVLREDIRVATIGGMCGRKYKTGRRLWERTYYGDVLTRIEREAVLRSARSAPVG